MASDEERKKAAKAEALRGIELDKKGLKPPAWDNYVIAYPFMVALSFLFLKTRLSNRL